MNGLGHTTALGEERVTYKSDPSNADRFIAHITNKSSQLRAFEADDMGRVLDYDGVNNKNDDSESGVGLSGAHSEPLTEGGLMLCEGNPDDVTFAVFHCCVKGGYLFYFDYEDVEDEEGYATYLNPPTGCIPLDQVDVEYPPGGRRVFREHAHTDAKSGYEFALAHVPKRKRGDEDDGPVQQRQPFFLVADTLGRRERWAVAIRARATLAMKPTLLRAGYTKISSAAAAIEAAHFGEKAHSLDDDDKSDGGADGEESGEEEDEEDDDDDSSQSSSSSGSSSSSNGGRETEEKTSKKLGLVAKLTRSKRPSVVEKEKVGDNNNNKEPPPPSASASPTKTEKKRTEKEYQEHQKEKEKSFAGKKSGSGSLRKRNNAQSSSLRSRDRVKSVQDHIVDAAKDEGLATAVVDFGVADFDELEWMDNFFQVHNDFDAPTKLREMEEWQALMKKNLKGAVLEQYEYFVQASGQMTTMGREVSTLKTLVETQVETIREMKEIDFAAAMKEGTDGRDEIMGREDAEKPDAIKYHHSSGKSHRSSDDRSAYSELSTDGPGQTEHDDIAEDDPMAPPIDVPEWLFEAVEEIGAFVRECRYNDSIDLLTKAKTELIELFEKHERPTAYRLRKVQVINLRAIMTELEELSSRISNRLEETLRRKNEALRQTSKRERADAHSASSTMISPCAVSDDTLYLHLLVKLGRNYQAAEAYSSRRTLLLMETLHERPISGSGTVDLVIYAAQLSQSFFSVLASSVEGFLDLFLSSGAGGLGSGGGGGGAAEDTMSQGDSSSIHSINNSKSLPSGAIAAVVLWCDGELSKFAAAFGGTRILANLALSPPPSSSLMEKRTQARIIGQDSNEVGKERQNAIQVAAQCLDQAFQHASSNLDAVGLPLTPRLAEYLRVRLKGCEAEVAEQLDERWHSFTNEWRGHGDPRNGNNGMPPPY